MDLGKHVHFPLSLAQLVLCSPHRMHETIATRSRDETGYHSTELNC